MKIALFGGRFDPPHIGHVQVAKEILKRQLADEVWLIPANTHPWRQMIASAQDRLAMTKLLEEEKIKVSDIEIKRGGETYTIDTEREILKIQSLSFRPASPNAKRGEATDKESRNLSNYWILGSDQLQDFHRWKDYKKLQKLIRFLVFPRKGYIPETLPKNFILIKDYTANDISSSTIRDRIKKGLPISNLVPKKVEEYIREKGLYQNNPIIK